MKIPLPPRPERKKDRSLEGTAAGQTMLRELAADGGANYILRSLPAAELELLRPHLEPVELPLRHLYYAKGARIPAVWFIEKGAASWLVEMKDGTLIEAGTIGREGVEGLPLVLGAEVAPARSVMQVPGNGFRLEASKFRELFPRCPVLQSRLAAYTQCFIVLAAQSAACNRLHELDQRCARWLLMAHDRADREESFYITQDYLAMMLGVRRAGVSQAASALKRRGVLEYSRGRVTVLDRAGLEASACECYAAVQEQMEKLLG
jgi:CRP-like cAMP-binding protein